jgi:hypothetical protein
MQSAANMNELQRRTYGDVARQSVVIICSPHLLYQTYLTLNMWNPSTYLQERREKIQWMYKVCRKLFVCISYLFCDPIISHEAAHENAQLLPTTFRHGRR